MPVGQGSYFKGWSSTRPTTKSAPKSVDGVEIYIGQVINVDYDAFGKIRVRLLGLQNQEDENIDTEAYPADLNMLKYPLPGELVAMCVGLQNNVEKGRFVTAYYYVKRRGLSG